MPLSYYKTEYGEGLSGFAVIIGYKGDNGNHDKFVLVAEDKSALASFVSKGTGSSLKDVKESAQRVAILPISGRLKE